MRRFMVVVVDDFHRSGCDLFIIGKLPVREPPAATGMESEITKISLSSVEHALSRVNGDFLSQANEEGERVKVNRHT